jgi:hypothetical protein
MSLGLMASDNAIGSAARFRPTGHGRRFLNDLQALFLPDLQVYSQSRA